MNAYEILEYESLDVSGLQRKYEKVLNLLQGGDFKGAQAKKLKGTGFYRSKLDDSNRLLFKFGKRKNKTYLMMLEVIRKHDYAQSRFLRGCSSVEQAREESLWQEINTPQELGNDFEVPLKFVNAQLPKFHYLDKPLSFDAEQTELFVMPLPAIVVGSAGSGKSALILERIKVFSGKILYVTLSSFLAQSARDLYFAEGYQNDDQQVDFYSLKELLQTVDVPEGEETTYRIFSSWFRTQGRAVQKFEPRKIFEEFRGVLQGSSLDSPYLSLPEYCALGIKQSIFLGEERNEIYALFRNFLKHQSENRQFDLSSIAYQCLSRVPSEYDCVCIDEVQDFTTVQIVFSLKFLKNPRNFLLCGDSNQIVHPNFFSWARLKSYLHQNADGSSDLIRILRQNYRNTTQVTELANKILKLKSARFGSLDRESNFLVKALSDTEGVIEFYLDSAEVRKEINGGTRRSTEFAIVTLSEEQKEIAKSIFQTPLIFTVHEAKGLEYPNVVLYNFVSSAEKSFRDLAEGVDPLDLEKDQLEYSRSKDKSDKSAEGLKFYINGLYVALTRSTQNVYWVEARIKHPFLALLELTNAKSKTSLHEKNSSLDAWQKEALKLEQQGKNEQAEEIRKNILKQHPVPWKIQSLTSLLPIVPLALDPQGHNKKEQRALFEMAYAHSLTWILDRLASAKYALASNRKDAEIVMARNFYAEYSVERRSALRKLVFTHGVQFQNQLGERPLTVAAKLRDVELISQLLEWGASRVVFGPGGLLPVGHITQDVVEKRLVNPVEIEQLMRLLTPSSLTLRFHGKLQKLDAKAPEFQLFQTVLAFSLSAMFEKTSGDFFTSGFDAATAAKWLSHFPDSIVPPWRKKRPYVSSLLSKHEADKILNEVALREHDSGESSPGLAVGKSKGLFVRTSHGRYMVNPALEIECSHLDSESKHWHHIVNVFPFEFALATAKDHLIERRISVFRDVFSHLSAGATKAEYLANLERRYSRSCEFST